MDFILLTPERNYTISNSLRVKAHLKNGLVEILDKHQFLMGLIENNLIEVESAGDQKMNQFFVVQDAIFIVSDTSFGIKSLKSSTTIYVYAKSFIELKKTTSREFLLSHYESKKSEFELELNRLTDNNRIKELSLVLSSKALLLKEEVEFFRNVLLIGEKINLMQEA